MSGLENYDCEGTLTIDGFSMNRPAWAIVADQNGNQGLLQLLTTVDVRGRNRMIPGAAGVIAYRRRIAETRYTLRLIVTGDVDEMGVVNTDSRVGLMENLEYLWDNITVPVASTTGTRAAVWTPPGGLATRSASIQIERVDQGQYAFDENGQQSIWVGSMVITVPAGRFS